MTETLKSDRKWIDYASKAAFGLIGIGLVGFSIFYLKKKMQLT